MKPNQYPMIWQGIYWWMHNKGITSTYLSHLTGFSKDLIESGIRGQIERLSSDFVHACVDVFGLRNSRTRGYEDTAYLLTDDECVELLTAPLVRRPVQGKLWD